MVARFTGRPAEKLAGKPAGAFTIFDAITTRVAGLLVSQSGIDRSAVLHALEGPARARITSAGAAPTYIKLVHFYREWNIIQSAITERRITSDSFATMKTAVNHFIAIAEEIDRRHVPTTIDGIDVKASLPFARYYAGVFALLEGNADLAYTHLEKAGTYNGLGNSGGDLAVAMIGEGDSKNVQPAAVMLGDHYTYLKDITDGRTPATPPAAAAPVPGPIAVPVRVDAIPIVIPIKSRLQHPTFTAENKQKVLDGKMAEARRATAQRNHRSALEQYVLALMIDPDNAAAKQGKENAVENIYDEINRRGSPAERIRLIRELITLKGEEARDDLALAQAYVDDKKYPDVAKALHRACDLSKEKPVHDEAEYIEINALRAEK